MYTEHDIKPNGMVEIWDLGPVRPVPPDPPVEPKKTGRGADDAVAMQNYEDALTDYKRDLARYARDKREFDDHRLNVAGPIKDECWPHEGNHRIEVQSERWAKDLPPGMKPGRAHIEAEAIAAKRAEETAKIKERDPHMGKGKVDA
jgi:hypothetical protein